MESCTSRLSEVAYIEKGSGSYPSCLEKRLHDARLALALRGNDDLIRERMVALFCSAQCSGALILQTYDIMQALRDEGVGVIGGFHSPMEKECLQILLRGTQSIIICPARSIERMRIPCDLKKPLEEGRLLFLSPFPEKERRVTEKNAIYRNRFVAALTDKVFVPHAEPGSKTEHLCREIISWKKPLYTLADPTNTNLVKLGAKPIMPDDVSELLQNTGR